jgi:hypothetical protein
MHLDTATPGSTRSAAALAGQRVLLDIDRLMTSADMGLVEQTLQ